MVDGGREGGVTADFSIFGENIFSFFKYVV